jgi:hypothetical protein
MDYVNWFATRWPIRERRSAVLRGYRALAREHAAVVADIALRNYVLSPAPAGDAIAIAIAEGRRQCALEILHLANMNIDQLWDIIERKQQPAQTRQ